jgi:hypothetical protein
VFFAQKYIKIIDIFYFLNSILILTYQKNQKNIKNNFKTKFFKKYNCTGMLN